MLSQTCMLSRNSIWDMSNLAQTCPAGFHAFLKVNVILHVPSMDWFQEKFGKGPNMSLGKHAPPKSDSRQQPDRRFHGSGAELSDRRFRLCILGGHRHWRLLKGKRHAKKLKAGSDASGLFIFTSGSWPSVANPKFASAWATLPANFGFRATLAIY